MTPLPEPAYRPPAWRRLGAMVALTAALGFAFQPTLLMAQVSTEPDVPVPAKPTKPAHKPAAKKAASRTQPNDTVADDLNRREAERVSKLAQGSPAPAPAAQPAAPQPAAPLPAALSKAADAKAFELKGVDPKAVDPGPP